MGRPCTMKGSCEVFLVFLLFLVWVGHSSANYTTQSYQHSKNPKPNFNGAFHNYRDALSKSILFYEGQRSGKLPANQRMAWRRDSALLDGSSQNVDLVGGYYDAGDNVKFGFPMAFTTTMLSWSVLEFGGFMGSELANAKTAIRWATDYLLKATVHPGTIYVQVGDPNNDHDCWERPEDMDTIRTVYKIDEQHPGSEVAAETAAALAAASAVFRKSDPLYSKQLIHIAMRVFDFADKHRGTYAAGICPFYCSYSGYQDELLWGAAWLYKTTRNLTYLNYIQVNGQSLGADQWDNVFGWDNKHAGARVLLSREFLIRNVNSLQEYKGYADNYICYILPGTPHSQAKYTPGGLLYTLENTNLQYVTSSSFLALTYAKYLSSSKQVVSCGGTMNIAPHRLRTFAKRQVDYILGDNPLKMPYMVGYGSRYPKHIHHRASSLPSKVNHPQPIPCKAGFQSLYSSAPNPNILVGAVVGGPDNLDWFADDRNNYNQSEPSTYVNAPLVGLLAYFAHSTGS